jgi:glycosyltransferase involved in cell wall biosynthesis
MRVSIVIPTFNRSYLLPQTISALANQQTTPDLAYEVIFVSNGSSDNSDVMLQDSVSRYPDRFRYFYIAPTGGPSAPRNVGIRAATGEVIIILDDDVLPDPDLLLKHAEFHKRHPEPHEAALGEVYVPPHLLDDPMSLFHSFPYRQVRDLDRLSYLHFWTCNVSVKRQFMLAHGMFDERFLYYEDMICAHRLARQGMHLHFLPSARGQHLHQLKASAIPAKGQWIGRWLYPFVEHLPEPAVKERFGILSMDIGIRLLSKRLLNRVAFRIVDNPATIACLHLFGARRSKRNRITDFYYFLIFRRNLLAGYYQAKREARAGRPLVVSTPRSERADK